MIGCRPEFEKYGISDCTSLTSRAVSLNICDTFSYFKCSSSKQKQITVNGSVLLS